VRIAKFKLTADEASGGGLMLFRELELVPVAPPPEAHDGNAKLAKARETFVREFRVHAQPAVRNYREKLARLEELARRANDTDAVVRIREERVLLQTPDKLALNTGADPAGVPVTLEVNDSFNCQFSGDTALDGARSHLTKLRPAGSASVTWRLPASNVGSGTYTVQVRGRLPAKSGGTASLAARGEANKPAGTPLKVVVDPDATAESRPKRPAGAAPLPADAVTEAGPLVIARGAETLTLSVESLKHADGGLMDLSGITLVRTGDAPGTAGTP
jgi:hypothetical protein